MSRKSAAKGENFRLNRFFNKLEELSKNHLKRALTKPSGIDFTSNDFLAFSQAHQIRQAIETALAEGFPHGAGGSRLLRGNYAAHDELESLAAEFFGSEKALYFANGYSANYAILTTLTTRHDLIVYDAYSHASIREGVFSSLARSTRFPHNDVDAVEAILSKWRKSSSRDSIAWIVVESLYSMDGDCAQLPELFEIADRYDAVLVVDEAHATGVWGDRGHGFTEPFAGRPNLVALHTCGKALGVSGGIVCASADIIDFMINKCRPFIYSTAPSPLNAVAVQSALRLLQEEPKRRVKLRELIRFANKELTRRFQAEGSGTQIIPFIIGSPEKSLATARELQKAGFDLRAIRPPTVPAGTSRLRISITLHVAEQDISDMFEALEMITDNIVENT